MPRIFQRVPGGNYYVRVYSGGGEKWRSLRTTKRREAERRAARLLYCAMPADLRQAVDKPAITLVDLWEEYARSHPARQLSKASIEDKARCYTEFCRAVRLKTVDQLTPLACAEYLEDIIAKSSPANARHHKTQVASVWGAMSVKLGIDNPWLNLPRISTEPGRVRHTAVFSPDQLAKILEAIKGTSMEGIVLLSLHTGARLKDAVLMRHEYLKGDIIEFLPSKTQRRGKPVRLPVHPSIRGFFGLGEGFLWPDEARLYQRKRSSHTNAFRYLLSKLGIKGEGRKRLSFHSLRATFISEMERLGVKRERVQGAVGHVDPRQTAAYSNVTIDAQDMARMTVARP